MCWRESGPRPSSPGREEVTQDKQEAVEGAHGGDLLQVAEVEVHVTGEGEEPEDEPEDEPDEEEEEEDDYDAKEEEYLNKFLNKESVVRPGQQMGKVGHIMSSGSEFVSTITLFPEAQEDWETTEIYLQ